MSTWPLVVLAVDAGTDGVRVAWAGLQLLAHVDFNMPGAPDPFGPIDLPGTFPPFIPASSPGGDGDDGDGADGDGDGPPGPPGPPDEPPPDDPPPDECEE